MPDHSVQILSLIPRWGLISSPSLVVVPPADKLLVDPPTLDLAFQITPKVASAKWVTGQVTGHHVHYIYNKSLQWVSPSFNRYPWGAMSCVAPDWFFPLPNLSFRRWWHRWYKAMYLIPLTWPFKNQVKNCWRQITNGTNHSTPCVSSYRRKAWSSQSFCYPCHWKLILLRLLLRVTVIYTLAICSLRLQRQ